MLLQVEDLYCEFAPKNAPATLAVRGVSFQVSRGELLGIVGESGSGKSVTAMSLVGLLDAPGRISSGQVIFDGIDLTTLPELKLRSLRGKRIAFIFQDPMTALNPVLTIGTQLIETLQAHEKVSKSEAYSIASGWLSKVRIPDADQRMRQYPFELSGGMRQRVMIAMAFCLKPELLIADEPTTALDVTVQAQILSLMDEMRRESQTAVVLITHDLGIVAERCDRVAVMYGGQIVESAPTRQIFESPKHPYTQALLDALPDVNRKPESGALYFLPGQPPKLIQGKIAQGCVFAPRCGKVMHSCRSVEPGITMADEADVRCLLYPAK